MISADIHDNCEVSNTEDRNINRMMLEQYVRRLYAVSKQINIHFFSEEYPTNIEKLKSEIQMMKGLIANIEITME